MKSKHIFVILILIILAIGILYLYNKQQTIQNIGAKTNTRVINQPINLIEQKTEEIDYIQTYIPKESKSGSCWTNSIASRNQRGWRCMVGSNSINDPCFEIDTNKLVCDVDPDKTESGFVLNLTEKLPPREDFSTREDLSTSQLFYWIIKLANGSKCWLNTGAADDINGEFYYYNCDKDNSVIIGELDKNSNPWYANVAYLTENRHEALRKEKTAILKVWK